MSHPPPQVDKWGNASNELLNFQSSVCFWIQLNGRRGAPVVCVLLYCGTIYETTTKSEIRQGCVKAAERWIYRIIGFSRLNKQNRVTKIDKTRFFVILEITFFVGLSKKTFQILPSGHTVGKLLGWTYSFFWWVLLLLPEKTNRRVSSLFAEDRCMLFQKLWASLWCLVSEGFVHD